MAERQVGREPPPQQNTKAQGGPAKPSEKLLSGQPPLTLPSLPRVPAAPSGPRPASSARLPTPGTSSGLLSRAGMRHTSPLRQPTSSQPLAPSEAPLPPRQPAPTQPQQARSQALKSAEQMQPRQASKGVMIIPGKKDREAGSKVRLAGRVQLVVLLCALMALALGLIFGGVLKNGSTLVAGQFTARPGGSVSIAQAPQGGPTLPPDLNTTDINYYITKYGFDPPKSVKPLPSDELARLQQMLPYALSATARYDARYQGQVEPEMLLWWTHAEEIGARINYSDCANEAPPSGSYFVSIANCDRPDFWQLGYGNQFGNIWVLKDAFSDMHGDPNNAALVQDVGQAVLAFDASQQTTPACGGYSCTFPTMTIDQIMADVHWHASDHKETISNWWASVLSRDPGINSYMLALALSSFSHAQTQNWVGCYYQEPCWQYESDSMWQVLANWKALGG